LTGESERAHRLSNSSMVAISQQHDLIHTTITNMRQVSFVQRPASVAGPRECYRKLGSSFLLIPYLILARCILRRHSLRGAVVTLTDGGINVLPRVHALLSRTVSRCVSVSVAKYATDC